METKKTKDLRALIAEQAATPEGYVRPKSVQSHTMARLVRKLGLKSTRRMFVAHYFSDMKMHDDFVKQTHILSVKKSKKADCKKAPKTKIRNIPAPAPAKTGIKSVKAQKKPVEIINNVKVKYIPCPEYRPLVMSRDCRMSPEIRAVHCSTPVLENT